jgi:hypothetical protein
MRVLTSSIARIVARRILCVCEWGLKMEIWRLTQAKACGAKFMTWLSSRDGRECDHCKAADGKIVPIEDFDVQAHMAG